MVETMAGTIKQHRPFRKFVEQAALPIAGRRERSHGREIHWQRELETVTELLLALATDLGGSYYLTFDALASVATFQQAYPRWREFASQKCRHDPQGMFTSRFFEKYFLDSGAAERFRRSPTAKREG
jgi:hypothetical protein